MADIGDSILARIVPHMVALGILLYGITAAKAAGSAGSSLYASAAGGRFGMGNALMAGYAGVKLGEKGVRGGWGMGKRNSSKFAGGVDDLHKDYRTIVGAVGNNKLTKRFTGNMATGMVVRDMAAQEAAKKEAIAARKKKYSFDPKNTDWKMLKNGDNVDKALALEAAAEQHELGDPELAKHFVAAASVMSQEQIKDLSRKNISFNALTAENQAKIKNKDASSFSAAAQARVARNVGSGLMTDEDAIKHEIMVDAATKAIGKNKDKEAQGLDQKDQARAWADAYVDTKKTDRIASKEDTDKAAFAKGMKLVAKENETKIRIAPAAHVNALKEQQVTHAVIGIKTGLRVDDAVAAAVIANAGEQDERIQKVYENKLMTAADHSATSTDDKEKYGNHATKDMLKALNKKNDGETLVAYRTAVKARQRHPRNAAEAVELSDKETFIDAALSA